MGSRRDGNRRAPPLEPGHSQLHWMRLALAGDQTLGVGHVDDEALESPHSKRWTLDEIRRHNSRYDCWMVLRGRVYNVTSYLHYHPGSVEEMMRCAGDDGTALFDEAHAYVNAEAILASCCIGTLAAPAATTATPPTDPTGGPALHPEAWRSFPVLSCTPAGRGSVLLRLALLPGQRLGIALGEHVQVTVVRSGMNHFGVSILLFSRVPEPGRGQSPPLVFPVPLPAARARAGRQGVAPRLHARERPQDRGLL